MASAITMDDFIATSAQRFPDDVHPISRAAVDMLLCEMHAHADDPARVIFLSRKIRQLMAQERQLDEEMAAAIERRVEEIRQWLINEIAHNG